MAKVGVVGYGVIGQRLADGVAAQEDMELVGIADVVPSISLRGWKERGMPHDLYCAVPGTDVGNVEKMFMLDYVFQEPTGQTIPLSQVARWF